MMDFQAQYNLNTWQNFLTGFLPEDYFQQDESLSLGFQTKHIENIRLVGACNSLELNVYVIKHASENDPRVSLSRETFRLMANYTVRRALVLFISDTSSNYRFSLVTLDYVLKDGKPTKEYSNPRRYSFFLGPDCKKHTPEQYLLKKGRITGFDDLLDRFSIEIVNKEFYNEIALQFTRLVGGERKIGSKKITEKGILHLPGKPIASNHLLYQEFAVRLIGRLVFCWFLKKKKSDAGIPLIPEDILSSKAVRNNDFYYHNILEHLFFQILNTPVHERNPLFKDERWNNTPFLNGGLFEPHDDDYYEPDKYMVSRHLNTLKAPDEWFLELFNIFETWNFTIDENTPVDVELSIDPEMLGRIFENLLAEINPETGETARKATGSYYTPRPIVEYMVDESLKQYLANKTGLDDKRLDLLLSYTDEPKLDETDKSKIMSALDSIKILDPACGSGAFPMGVLQKLVLILQKADPYAEQWLISILEDIKDPTARQLLKQKLQGETGLWDFSRKLGIIRKSIYGVDIQPVAVEIAKLRCFLSLIVDEQVDDVKPNRGIEALPNLEFKFVAANTLIGLYEGNTEVAGTESYVKELEKLRDEWFTCLENKESIKQSFLKIQDDLSKHIAQYRSDSSVALKIVNWNPFSHERADFFDPKWMFGVLLGFDIIISNPPYGVSIMGKKRKEVLNSLVKVPDFEIYYFFIEIAHKLLKDNGIKSYIIPNTILFNVFAYNYRKTLLNKWSIKTLLDCTNFKFFEKATVFNIITIFVKEKNADKIIFKNTKNVSSFEELIKRPTSIISKDILLLNNKNWGLVFKLDNDILDLITKIKENSIELSSLFPDISQGLIAYDKYQGQSKDIIENRIYHYSKKEKPDLKPWLWGQDVTRYCVIWNGKEYIDYCDGLANPRQPKYFKNDRILVREITNPRIFAAFTDKEMYNDPAIINILKGNKLSIMVLLPILNSKLATFYHFNSSPKATKGAFPKILVKDIKEFPIPSINIKNRPVMEKIEKLVEEILQNKANNKDTSTLEKEVDALVYRLYELTEEEIAIIEGAGL